MKMEQAECSEMSAYIKFRCRGMTQKKEYNIQNMAKVCNQEVNGNYLGFFIYVGIISVFKRVKLVIGCIRSQMLRGYVKLFI